jgi:hypothetical protein
MVANVAYLICNMATASECVVVTIPRSGSPAVAAFDSLLTDCEPSGNCTVILPKEPV